MKSERRHDLETNQLAVQVQDFIERAKPYTSQIALVILGLVVLGYIATAWGNASIATENEAWTEFTLASYSGDPELNSMKLLAENEEFSGTPVPEWAYLAWSDRQLLLASQSYLTDRATTNKRLEQILPIYQEIAAGGGTSQLQDRARYGIAQVLEMQGKVKEASAAYKKVKGDLAEIATARADQLDSSSVDTVCEWLATAELPKRETPAAGGATLGTKPDFDAEFPAATPRSTPITDSRTLEEIIGGESGAVDVDRYQESEKEASTATEAPVDGVSEVIEEKVQEEAADTPADDQTSP